MYVVGTRLKRITEAVLTFTRNQCFEQNVKRIIFNVENILCILHGIVFVMRVIVSQSKETLVLVKT